MNVVEINSSNFDEIVLKSGKKVLVDFNASWCGPCRMLAPVIEKLSEEKSNVVFASVNIDNEQQLADEYGIFSIPCLVLFESGKEVARMVGLKPKEEIEEFIGE